MLTDTGKSPYAIVQPLGSRDTVWTGGFWKDVENVTFAETVPELQKMFDNPGISHVVENFRIAAGEKDGEFSGTVFGDGDFYKWMEACMYDAAKTGNRKLLEDLDQYITLIGRAQQPDGYLSTKQIIGERSHNGVRRMGDINDFEVYNFGHLFTAAALYYRLTGKDIFLKIASGTADYLGRLYDEAEKKGEIQTAVCPSHYMGLVELYRATGEKKYLTLAKKAVILRDKVSHGLDDNQDRIPLKKQHRIIGHAVRANYLYAGVADLYLEEGDPDYRKVLESVWKDLLSHKIYITGGCGALYNGASPYGNFMDHQLIHQAYGYSYQLPNITAYNETCAGVGLIMWAYRMFLADPKAEYFDVIEKVFLNENLAAVSLDGLRFFYENMLERQKCLDYPLIWPLHRTNYITSYCCPPNLARSLAEATEYAYARSIKMGENTLYAGLYGACDAEVAFEEGPIFILRQETDYPYSGVIIFSFPRIQQEGAFTLALRIPVWAENALVTISEIGTDGDEKNRTLSFGPENAGTYQKIQVRKLRGTKISLTLPMEVRFTQANDMAEEDQGKAAVERGPLVYCMESADLDQVQGDYSLNDLSLIFAGGKGPSYFREKVIRIENRKILSLEGKMQAAQRPRGQRSSLYRTLKPCAVSEIPVRMIPYFAWDNRSPKEDEDTDGPNA